MQVGLQHCEGRRARGFFEDLQPAADKTAPLEPAPPPLTFCAGVMEGASLCDSVSCCHAVGSVVAEHESRYVEVFEECLHPWASGSHSAQHYCRETEESAECLHVRTSWYHSEG
eukprot:CAMPEP_0115541892 /NCGR_PEP_ID=MMETSP0271-20121206/90712_1 /TAXON_ID=71861 /ORGANISM="Scrippsiella trochoidea, Strain CCMP3099" /LENGTH=113 /DNA_ID=CAMNT_0002975001 /DNA_START=218 /DNA_END=559 /DNA_ORIENTATION=-